MALCASRRELVGEAAASKQPGTFNTVRLRGHSHRDVLEQVNRIVLDVVGDEKIICHCQESHLWDGENVHELLHLWPLETHFHAYVYKVRAINIVVPKMN